MSTLTPAMHQIATGLHFPTSFTFDDAGVLYVAESGLAFDGAPAGGRVWRLDAHDRTCLKQSLRTPVNGLTHHDGMLYISEGGQPGRISRFDLSSGKWSVVLDGLPGGGNYHTNMAVVGPDDKLYFGQGAATNSGIVGPDANDLSWLRKLPHPHDIPGRDIVLTGANATARLARHGADADDPGGDTETGAFQPFNQPASAHQRLNGRLPCTAAVMRCELDGSQLELVAWGLRNPYGLGFLRDGRLLAVNLGINQRGSRPVANVPDCLYEVRAGQWYGWPDYCVGKPVTDSAFLVRPGPSPRFLLANHDELGRPAKPLVTFAVNAAPTRFAEHPDRDDLVVSLFGDKRPFTAPSGPQVGRSLVRVRVSDWSLHAIEGPLLHRPIDVAFHPLDGALCVLDFGRFEMGAGATLTAEAGSGTLWKFDV